MTTLDRAVVLITGANGGLGTEFVRQALERGATKVYATARHPREWDDDRIVPLTLDVTDRTSVRAAAAASDVTVLINNAGGWSGASLLSDDLTAARNLFETNFWGPLEVTNAFFPSIAAAHGAIVNVLSVMSWIAHGDSYSASKAALWSATNVQRLALARADVQVIGLLLGPTDTPLASGLRTADKNDPADVVRATLDGLEAGKHEVLADEISRRAKAGLSGPITALYPQLSSSTRVS